jgi:hypothetical protein
MGVMLEKSAKNEGPFHYEKNTQQGPGCGMALV